MHDGCTFVLQQQSHISSAPSLSGSPMLLLSFAVHLLYPLCQLMFIQCMILAHLLHKWNQHLINPSLSVATLFWGSFAVHLLYPLLPYSGVRFVQVCFAHTIQHVISVFYLHMDSEGCLQFTCCVHDAKGCPLHNSKFVLQVQSSTSPATTFQLHHI